MEYPFFDTKRFKFRDEGGTWTKIASAAMSKIYPRLPTGRSPIRPSDKKARYGHLVLSIWEASHFGDERIEGSLRYHTQRINLYRLAFQIPYFIISLGVVGLTVLLVGKLLLIVQPLLGVGMSAGEPTFTTYLLQFGLMMLANLVIFLYTIAVAVIAIRIAFTLVNKNFADTLCAITVTYLLADLCRDDVLSDGTKRNELILRMNDLARGTRLLAFRHSRNSNVNQKWIREHFRQIELYIQARERWAVAPVATTLGDLRKDFGGLAAMYFTGNYGEFAWAPIDAPEEAPSRGHRLLSTVPKIMAIFLPVALVGLLLWQQARLEPLGINISIIILVLAAWALLSVDAALKLGIVSGVVNLAKEIKSLK